MNKIIGIIITMFSLTAFAGSKEETSVKLVKETLTMTLKCDRETSRRQARFSKYDCWLQDITKAAKTLAKENGGEYLNYEIVKAPKGFERHKYNQRENELEILVKYLK